MHGYLRFTLLYWRSAVFCSVLGVGIRSINQGFGSLGLAARFFLVAFLWSVALHSIYALLYWHNFVNVNRCRRRKLFGAPAARQGAATDDRQRVPIEVWWPSGIHSGARAGLGGAVGRS